MILAIVVVAVELAAIIFMVAWALGTSGPPTRLMDKRKGRKQ